MDFSDNRLPDSTSAELRPVMGAIAYELLDLAQTGTALQVLLSPQRLTGNEGLQALDLLTQRLFALTDFFTALMPAVAASYRVDLQPALATICLSDMADRLSAGSAGTEPSSVLADRDNAGILDLF